MLTDAKWAEFEPLVAACRPKGKPPPQGQAPAPRASPRPRICGARSRPSSGGIRTGPSGAPSRLNSVPGPVPLRSSSRSDLPPLGAAGRLGAAFGAGPRPRRSTRDDVSRRDQHPGAPEGGGCRSKRGSQAERDQREALGRARGGYGTKACVIADGLGRAVAFILAPGQAHERPHAVPLLDRLPGGPQWVGLIGAIPVTPSGSTFGSAAHVRLFRPRTTRRQSLARTGSTPTATKWSGSGQGSRSGGLSRPATRKPPPASWASSASPQPSTGSSHNRP